MRRTWTSASLVLSPAARQLEHAPYRLGPLAVAIHVLEQPLPGSEQPEILLRLDGQLLENLHRPCVALQGALPGVGIFGPLRCQHQVFQGRPPFLGPQVVVGKLGGATPLLQGSRHPQVQLPPAVRFQAVVEGLAQLVVGEVVRIIARLDHES